MAGEFDVCEYVWNQERAMQRLISYLRQSQGHCTDTECFVDAPNQQNEPMDSTVFLMFAWALMVVAAFVLRPANLRQNVSKPSNQNNGSPPPPSATT